jgi:mono/diheme cytochrome c family protein
MLKPLFLLPALLVVPIAAQTAAAPTTAASAAAPTTPAAAAATIPPDAATMVNRLKPTADVLAKAKKMYGYECAMCHGATGDGKGELVADMKLSLKDYTDPAALSGTSDGEIFNIIKNGKGQMTGEGARAKQDDVWALVLLVRSFAKK